jgi:hypothetical protein
MIKLKTQKSQNDLKPQKIIIMEELFHNKCFNVIR